ncbi:Bug family tripartite tricarboxylate transporter substrate binding protein [Bradyrhizobium sp.]|uniref:Bug family tripartite tricarboxylate transporter substrate binding protein n=1 Tax=Bradyrhizobium sp. TaxID=376 RepID=UPI003C759B31
MILPRRRFLHLATGAAALQAKSRIARADTYPSRPVRVIVPFAPGGQTDVIGRLLAQKLSAHFGKQYYVENMPGAGGNIAVGRAAQAVPDGYTMLVTDISLVVNPSLHTKVPYDPFKDFELVSLAVTTTQVLTVNPSLPVQTVKDLVDLIKVNPGKYSYASPGIGTPGHLAGELLRMSAGLDLVNVPFGGAGPAINSTIGGHTPIAFGSPAAIVPQITDGKLRALAVASKTRVSVLPGVPTMAEAGFPDVECDVWVGLLVPAKTPKEIITLLNRETNEIVALPDMKERLTSLGFQPFPSTPEEAAERVRTDSEKWAKIILASGIKAE